MGRTYCVIHMQQLTEPTQLFGKSNRAELLEKGIEKAGLLIKYSKLHQICNETNFGKFAALGKVLNV